MAELSHAGYEPGDVGCLLRGGSRPQDQHSHEYDGAGLDALCWGDGGFPRRRGDYAHVFPDRRYEVVKMRKKIGYGMQAVSALIVIYVIEMAVLGFIYRFLSEVPYKLVAPPVVAVVVLVAWVTAFVDMKKRGER